MNQIQNIIILLKLLKINNLDFLCSEFLHLNSDKMLSRVAIRALQAAPRTGQLCLVRLSSDVAAAGERDLVNFPERLVITFLFLNRKE